MQVWLNYNIILTNRIVFFFIWQYNSMNVNMTLFYIFLMLKLKLEYVGTEVDGMVCDGAATNRKFIMVEIWSQLSDK